MRRRALDDVDERLAILEPQRHEHARHDREVERHVELVARAEVRADVLGPHVGLGQQHLAREVRVQPRAQLLEHGVGLGQVLAGRALALDEIGHGVDAEPVDAEIEPELHDLPDLLADGRVVVVQVRLVAEEPVPVVGLGDRVPGPVRELGVDEDDADAAVAIVGVAPHVPVAAGIVRRAARLDEPGVLIGGVIQDELDDDAQPARVRLLQERLEVLQRAVARMDARVVGDVIPIVAEGRWIHGLNPRGSRRRATRDGPASRSSPTKSPMPSPLLSANDLTCS